MTAFSRLLPFITLSCSSLALASNIVLTNDDGWAVANIRAQYADLVSAGYDVILSCPAENESGTGSDTETPQTLTEPCEYDTCPTGSPAEGYNSSDTHLNYVNAYPVDAVRYGIQTLAPELFDGAEPDFVVSGPNVGTNTGSTTQISGTVGAACEAAKEGYPATAFSGDTGAQNGCSDASDYEWVFSRNVADSSATDYETCGSTTLPTESSVVDTSGCYASVSVLNATTKTDVDATIQGEVYSRLTALPFSCLPSS
ncbi:sure-like protein [Daedalea quercina L-15889]|uniref:Sure-like protein n=1 Tax=Daedalea quercina L-15889 TaxID=1314783 RepID=A0A165QH42_9APHY|nr:sure-like protein [Daedalea quercina L-15889]